jgi:hypothetical protein
MRTNGGQMMGNSARVVMEQRDFQTNTGENGAIVPSQGRSGQGLDRGHQAGVGSNEMSSIGAISVGGMRFELPEQVAVLLQKAFEAMSNTKAGETVAPGKGKTPVMGEPVEEGSKPLPLQDVAKSSKQGAARKEVSGKSMHCLHYKTKCHAIEECACFVTFVRVQITPG